MTQSPDQFPRVESEAYGFQSLRGWLPSRRDRTMAELWKIDESD